MLDTHKEILYHCCLGLLGYHYHCRCYHHHGFHCRRCYLHHGFHCYLGYLVVSESQRDLLPLLPWLPWLPWFAGVFAELPPALFPLGVLSLFPLPVSPVAESRNRAKRATMTTMSCKIETCGHQVLNSVSLPL